VNESTDRVALVTGANKGIGFEVARQLGQSGFRVLLGARNPNLGEAAAHMLRTQELEAEFVELDVLRTETIADVAAAIGKRFQRLDVLVNNAGIGDRADGLPGVANIESLRRILETNFLGVVAVTQAMLPWLRKSPAARIVNVSSGLGSLAYNSDPKWEYAPVKLLGYCSSKAALNMLTAQLAYELRDTPIKVNSDDPGYTATDLNGRRGTQTVEQGAAEAVRLALLPADGPTGGFFNTSGVVPW